MRASLKDCLTTARGLRSIEARCRFVPMVFSSAPKVARVVKVGVKILCEDNFFLKKVLHKFGEFVQIRPMHLDVSYFFVCSTRATSNCSLTKSLKHGRHIQGEVCLATPEGCQVLFGVITKQGLKN